MRILAAAHVSFFVLVGLAVACGDASPGTNEAEKNDGGTSEDEGDDREGTGDGTTDDDDDSSDDDVDRGDGDGDDNDDDEVQDELQDGECRRDSDCDAEWQVCYRVGQSPLPGVCFDVEQQCGEFGSCVICNNDDDCGEQGETSICEPAKGSCSGGKICTEGCVSDDDCGLAQTCNATHRCEARPCSDDEECPENFDCAQQQCARVTCESDADCDDYCVQGFCQAAPGRCDAFAYP